MKEFEILITSPPDRENFVAEIWIKNQMIAEICQETGEYELIIYEKGTLNYGDFLEALIAAKQKLARE